MNYKTKVIIGDAVLYLGDARDIAPDLPKADLVLSDVPYLLTYGGAHGSMGGCLSTDNYDNKGGLVDCDITWQEIMKLLYNSLSGPHAYVMCNNRNVQAMLNEAEKAGFRFHNLLVWDKGTCTPNRWYMKNCEFVGFFYKGKAQFIDNCSSRMLTKYPQKDVTNHPTEKPEGLMRHYICNSTAPGYTVIDPFMGSGTTGVACIQSGRKFIGIESNPKWFEVACERMREALSASKQGELI